MKKKKKVDPAISAYYSKLGKSGAKKKHKKILDKIKAENQKVETK